ncbi:hypothetical protein K461DRAFT_273065 [Myriangium duriaei CBS 260.36]|uniref:Uncharacterized protein n=1 Tax=Myriangium duriaei CBS 260.36 TaxID=1168546 RepID=A0A9P4JC74_9PEZI|nr:hypothetical protein K461DRAFT_273065 [Myriangium duriaei CBS 260.36]
MEPVRTSHSGLETALSSLTWTRTGDQCAQTLATTVSLPTLYASPVLVTTFLIAQPY